MACRFVHRQRMFGLNQLENLVLGTVPYWQVVWLHTFTPASLRAGHGKSARDTGNAFSVLIKLKFWDSKSRCLGEFTRVNASSGVSEILAAGLSWPCCERLCSSYKIFSNPFQNVLLQNEMINFAWGLALNHEAQCLWLCFYVSSISQKRWFSIEKRKRSLQNGFFLLFAISVDQADLEWGMQLSVTPNPLVSISEVLSLQVLEALPAQHYRCMQPFQLCRASL